MLSNDTVHDCEVYGRLNGIPSLAGICKSYRSQSQERARVSPYDTRAVGTLKNVMMKRPYLPSSSPFTSDISYGLYGLNVDQCSDGTQQDTYSDNNYQTRKLTSRLRAGDRIGIDSDDPMGPQNRPLGTLNPMMDRTVAMEGNGMYSTYSGQNNSKALRNKSHVTGEHVARLQADAYTNSYDKDRGKASKNKPKSGGIYGLLLKSGIEGSEVCSQGQQKASLSGNISFPVDKSASIELEDVYENISNDSSVYGAGLMKSSPNSVIGTGLIKSSHNSVIGNQGDSPSKLSNRDDKGRGIGAVTSHSSAQLLNSSFSRIADPTHVSPSDSTLKASSSSCSSAPSGTGQVHLRPKSAFGRSSVGASQHTSTSQSNSSSSSSQCKSNDSRGIQSMRRSLSVQKIHRDRDRDAAQDLRISQSTPKIATWPSVEKVIMAGGGVGLLSKELSPFGTRPSTPNMKYNSSGRVTHAHSNASSSSSSSAIKSIRCSVDVREGEGEGVTKRPAVFRLLEHSLQLERERAALQGQVNGNGRSRPSKQDCQSLSSSAVDDDDDSLMTLTSIAPGEGLAVREGSVRQSLVLLKARKKSMTSTPRLSRQNSSSTIPITARGGLGCGQDDEREQEQGPCDDNDGVSDDYSAHTSKNACSSSSSKGSEHGSFDTSGVQSLDPWGASIPWSDGSLTSGAQSNKSTLPTPSSRDTYTNIDVDVAGAGAVPSTWSLSVSRSKSKDQQTGSSDARESAPVLSRHQQSLSMHPCPHCGRNFALEPLNRHTKVCSRIFLKKRGVFDSVQMRGGTTDGSRWGSTSSSTPSVHKKNIPRTVNKDKGGDGEGEKRGEVGVGVGVGGKWRTQSEIFRESIKAVKMSPETGPRPRPGTPTGIGIGISPSSEMSPAVTRIVDPTLVPCPHCCRR